MFERFVRLAQARKALKNGHFEQAIQLAGDPLIRDHRRAAAVRDEALRGLIARAGRRADAEQFSAALADVSRVLAHQPDFDGAADLRAGLRDRMSAAEQRVRSARELLAEGRRMAEQGDLRAAAEVCATVRGTDAATAELEGLQTLIQSRQNAAAELLDAARQARRDRALARAGELLGRARGLDRHAKDLDAEAAKLAEARAKELVPKLREAQRANGAPAAMALLNRERAALPELGAVARIETFARTLSGDERQQLLAQLGTGDLDAALEAFDALDHRTRLEESIASLVPAFETLRTALAQRDRGNFAIAEESVRTVGNQLGLRALEPQAKALRRAAKETEAALAKARGLYAEGQLVEAREVLLAVLQKYPTHEGARREMEILDQGAQDKETRLGDARRLAKEGRLREASGLIVNLAVPGPQGDDARVQLRDLQQRMDLVANGLQQVLRSIHGRDSATRDGLLHCVRRLEELEKIQTDNEELVALKAAAQAEIDGLDELTAASRALEAGKVADFAAAIHAFREVRAKFLRRDRLDARALDLLDRVFEVGEAAINSGALARAKTWFDAVEPCGEDHADVRQRVAECSARIEERMADARARAAEARGALEGRDLAGAQESLEQARLAWVDGPEVLKVERAVQSVREHEEGAVDVESLAAREDYAGARRKLDDLGPTPGVLRTRIFDLKKNIAQAQGLDHAFILRVDEGGEFVVLRKDSITIGNLRENQSDLPMLANLAGRHARIQRKMSFHGGMQDVIRPENGEVFVAGERVTEQTLRHGLRVRLGPSVELDYAVPSRRSLTALVGIRGGFQVAGTDKVLLMKDRGRDGRILIGAGDDAHVHVAAADQEVELFANKDGQVRVRYAGQGRIDGRPFQGEHPVTAGAVITCGAVTFVLQPWGRA